MTNKLKLQDVDTVKIEEVLRKTDCIIKEKRESPISYICKRAFGLNRETIQVEYDEGTCELSLSTEYESTFRDLFDSFNNITDPQYIHKTPFFSSKKINLLNKLAISFVFVIGLIALIGFGPSVWNGIKKDLAESDKENFAQKQDACRQPVSVIDAYSWCVTNYKARIGSNEQRIVARLIDQNRYYLETTNIENQCHVTLQVNGQDGGKNFNQIYNCVLPNDFK